MHEPEPIVLDGIEQRALGVLLEKELAVPESYPLTQNALLLGCNQKSNREPLLEVDDSELDAALRSLAQRGLTLRVNQAGSRAVRFRHLAEEKLSVTGREKAVLAELLVRGPQAPGALKPRVARLGMAASPEEILVVLQGLATRNPPLAVQLPRQPRERDQRWAHGLGASNVPSHDSLLSDNVPAGGLEERIERLEAAVDELRAELERLTAARQ